MSREVDEAEIEATVIRIRIVLACLLGFGAGLFMLAAAAKGAAWLAGLFAAVLIVILFRLNWLMRLLREGDA